MKKGVFGTSLIVLCSLLMVGCARKPAERLPVTTSSSEARRLFEEGMALVSCYHHAEARDHFRKAVELDPNFALGYLGLSFVEPGGGTLYSSVRQADQLSQPVERAPRYAVGFGISLVDEAGAKMINEASKRTDRVSEGERLWIRGQLAQVERDQATALTCFRKLASLHPRDPNVLLLLGNCYFGFSMADSAIQAYHSVLSLDSTMALAYNMLGYEYQEIGDMVRAEEMLRRYAELLPNEPNPCDSYAEFLLRQKRYDESIRCYQKALALDSTFSNAQIGIATNLMLMGRGADARVRLAAGCAAARDAAERRMLTLSQAISYLFENNPDSCLAVMRQRSEFVEANHDPIESARDRDMQGQILSHYGRYPEAADQFETALAIVRASPLPEEVQELHRLRYHQHMGCDIAIPTGNFREAEVHLAEVEKCAERGDRPRVEFVLHYYRGLMAAANGDYPAAVKEYEQSFSADHLVLFQMGSAYEKMNERDQAMMYYQKAIATPALNSVAYALLWLRVREALARVGDAVS